MAMAHVAVTNGSKRQAHGEPCPEHPRKVWGESLGFPVGGMSFGNNTMLFTPLHTTVLRVLLRKFGLFLWGESSPRTAATSSHNFARVRVVDRCHSQGQTGSEEDTAEAQNVMRGSSPALTSARSAVTRRA